MYEEKKNILTYDHDESSVFGVLHNFYSTHFSGTFHLIFRLTSADISLKVPENCQAKVVQNTGLIMNRLYDLLGKITGLLCFKPKYFT